MEISEALQYCTEEEKTHYRQPGGQYFVLRLGEARKRIVELEHHHRAEMDALRVSYAETLKNGMDAMIRMEERLERFEQLADVHEVLIPVNVIPTSDVQVKIGPLTRSLAQAAKALLAAIHDDYLDPILGEHLLDHLIDAAKQWEHAYQKDGAK